MEKGGRPGPLFAEGMARAKPRSLIEAISEIQILATVVKTGREIPENYLLLDRRIAYFEVGVKGALADGLISALFVPMSMGVLSNLVPIFGTLTPSLFDQLFSVLIAMAYGLGYNVMIGVNLGNCYYGKACRQAIDSIYSAMVTFNILKVILLFLLFHGLYGLLTPDWVHAKSDQLWPAWRVLVNQATAVEVQTWILNVREVLLLSSWFVVFSTAVSLIIPRIFFVRGSKQAELEHRRNMLYDGY